MTEQMISQDEHNAFVLENVLDTQGYASEVKCPSCDQSAEVIRTISFGHCVK